MYKCIRIQCEQKITIKMPAKLRADSSTEIQMKVIFSLANSSSPDWNTLFLRFRYRRYVNGTNVPYDFLIYYIVNNTVGCVPSGNPSALFYSVAMDDGLAGSLHCLLGSQTTYYVGTTYFTSYLTTRQQWISKYDVLEEIAFIVQIGGKASYNLNVETMMFGAVEATQSELIPIGNWTYHNLQYLQNMSSPDYLNATYSAASTTITGIVIYFSYSTSSAIKVHSSRLCRHLQGCILDRQMECGTHQQGQTGFLSLQTVSQQSYLPASPIAKPTSC